MKRVSEKDIEEVRLVAISDLQSIFPVSRTTIYRIIDEDGFPKSFSIRNRQFWRLHEVSRWLERQRTKEELI